MHYYGVERSGTSLTHHGIKGMKWGIRRYQNKDGTLTAAGKERYNTYREYRNDKIRSIVDTSSIKDKAQKYKQEDDNLTSTETYIWDDASDLDSRIARGLLDRILTKSGRPPFDMVTKDGKAAGEKYIKAMEKHKNDSDRAWGRQSKEELDAEDEISSVILKDSGYEDDKKHRARMTEIWNSGWL